MFLIINITDVEDAITLKNGRLIEAVFTHASEILNAGGRIIIQREYVNASPDILATFTIQADLEDWKSRIDDILSRLDEQQ
jgi:precorrin-6B methylase 2